MSISKRLKQTRDREEAGRSTGAQLFNFFQSYHSAPHTGLSFAYGPGKTRNDNVVTHVSTGTVTLTDDTTNYVETTKAGVVSANTSGYTSGSIPLYKVTTASGVMTAIQDDRCFWA